MLILQTIFPQLSSISIILNLTILMYLDLRVD